MSLANVRARRTAAGFTLIELMITVAILGIVAAIAVTAYNGYIETATVDRLHKRIDSLRIFEENYRIDNGEYFAGVYDTAEGNDFATTLGYRVDGDDDGVRLVVTACDGGDIEDCMKITATDREGTTAVWNNGEYQ